MDRFTCNDWANLAQFCGVMTHLVKSKSIKSRKEIGLHLTKKKSQQ